MNGSEDAAILGHEKWSSPGIRDCFHRFFHFRRHVIACFPAKLRDGVESALADLVTIEIHTGYSRDGCERDEIRRVGGKLAASQAIRSEEHTSELQSPVHPVCR